MAALGKDGPDQAPPKRERQVSVGSGASARTVDVPAGIDPGFAYAPGRSSVGAAVQRTLRAGATQPPAVAASGIKRILDHPAALQALSDDWRDWRRQSGDRIEDFRLGAILPAVHSALRAREVKLESTAVTISRAELAHATRASKQSRGQALADGDLDRLPEGIAMPEAVLWERDADALLYIFSAHGEQKAKAKAFVRMNYRHRTRRVEDSVKRRMAYTNAVRTTGYVHPDSLRQADYTLIWGSLDD